ncbi:UPF0271 protein [Lipingzhangella halophila]|uniref:UPF0271 protein n=1 Tax=Lipingzhangella halophila TaxID=1783352 RepID=A0A7W7RCV4_9ACTN|nr:5-oxoprolinase subunit PxpA [Lipingzhangella halophila]MBB4929647.1 UPF0271 protein [Lipingzhangella halophila]
MRNLVDLNADAGESFGRWSLGDDARLLPHVTSVNVACGWHAGDPATMRASVELAAENGVGLGAHPGLPDLAGFGRRALALTPREAADACLYQYGALRAFADAHGVPITHVKPHGAFYGLAIRDHSIAAAVVDAVGTVDGEVVTVLLAGPTADAVAGRGVPVAREAFADLDYDDNGHIIIEPNPAAKDPRACADQAAAILSGRVRTVSGGTVGIEADTICVHGDRPNAVDVARAVRARIAAEGATVAPLRDVLAARRQG